MGGVGSISIIEQHQRLGNRVKHCPGDISGWIWYGVASFVLHCQKGAFGIKGRHGKEWDGVFCVLLSVS